MTADGLLRAEQTLEGEALVEAQLLYLRTNPGYSFPGALHEADECDVCDSRREALRRWLDEDDDASA